MSSQPNNHSSEKNPVGRFMVAVGAVIEHEKTGKILILRRADSEDWQGGEWEIDYGRIDQFEDPEHGLRREVREETGLADLTIGRVLSVWHIHRGEEKSAHNDLIGITFATTTRSNSVTLSHEHSEYRWVDPEEALALISVEGIRRDVKLYQKMKEEQNAK